MSEVVKSLVCSLILKMSTKAKSTPVSSKASKTLKGQSKGKKINPKPLCNLCGSPFEDEEETLHCEGDCGQIYHRYCAGISKAYYSQLCDKATPFVCLVLLTTNE